MTTARPTNAERAKAWLCDLDHDVCDNAASAVDEDSLTALLDTVAREEREACAKVAERELSRPVLGSDPLTIRRRVLGGSHRACKNIAAAIRARAAGKVGG